jgi:hypothetical protein
MKKEKRCVIVEKKEQKTSNFETAIYIAKTYGHNISDDNLTEVAKTMKLKPKVLIKNYKWVVSINEIL